MTNDDISTGNPGARGHSALAARGRAQIPNPTPSPQRGIALIVVVGLLAVLTLAAVAFSVAMRVERKGASHFRDTVQARQMLWTALCAAVEEINRSMETNATLYPMWSVLASPGSGEWVGKAPVMSRAFAPFIQKPFATPVDISNPQWTAIDAAGQVRGRYAYIAINTSGLLDANQVGGAPRGIGASPRELAITNTILSDFVDSQAVSDFLEDRKSDLRYETLGELSALNTGLSTNHQRFDVFSLSPEHQIVLPNGNVTNRVYIGTNASLWDAVQIMAAFRASGVPAAHCGLAYSNLLDYVDSDSIPRSLASGCTEPVPMINEVLMPLCQFQFAGTSFVQRMGFAIECFYPFATPMTNTYTLFYDVRFVNNGGGNEYVPPVVITNSATIAPGPAPYRVITIQPPINRSGAIVSTNKADFFVYISGYIEDEQKNRVDEVPSPFNPPVTRGPRIRVMVPVVPGTTNVAGWAECIDPRFNWNPEIGGADRQWYRSDEIRTQFPAITNATPGTTNHMTRFYFNPQQAPFNAPSNPWDLDDDTLMHVANRPLQSVGELGNIAYTRWSTIRLYDHRFVPALDAPSNHLEGVWFHRVLDYFTLYSTNAPYAHGRANANTDDTNVLATVFLGLPQEEYNAASTNRIGRDAARQIARDLYRARPLRRMSDLGSVTNLVAPVSGATEIGREAVIRNACELLTVRHNLFTILLLADSFSADIGGRAETGSTLASARGVAQVWRDPYPVTDRNGVPVRDQSNRPVHRWFVRFFQIMED